MGNNDTSGIDECLSNLSKAQIPLMEWLADTHPNTTGFDDKYKKVKEQCERLDGIMLKMGDIK